jgi:hypothetical protein
MGEFDYIFGYHPYPTPTANEGASVNPEEMASDIYGGVDNSSRYVGALVLGALAGLIAMKALGFRFSFGVAAGR